MAPIPPRSRTLAEIKSKLLNPATTSHFSVNIGKPSGGDFQKFLSETGAFNDQDRLNMMCSNAQLPGSQFATAEITNDFSGVTERHIHRRMYDQKIDLTFYCDAEQYLPIRFFEAWMNYMCNETTDGGPQGKVSDPNFFYRMKFPNSYKGSLEVTKFEKNIESQKSVKPLTYSFINAFPLSINSMPVSYDASSLLKCTVGFTYSRYYIDSGGKGFAGFLNPIKQALFNGQALSPGGIPNVISRAAGNAVGNTIGNQRVGAAVQGVLGNLL
tara:strand:+ start:2923 stop:3732 length:810 start_codon:yes stop_codon:yes gene_type:complete